MGFKSIYNNLKEILEIATEQKRKSLGEIKNCFHCGREMPAEIKGIIYNCGNCTHEKAYLKLSRNQREKAFRKSRSGLIDPTKCYFCDKKYAGQGTQYRGSFCLKCKKFNQA